MTAREETSDFDCGSLGACPTFHRQELPDLPVQYSCGGSPCRRLVSRPQPQYLPRMFFFFFFAICQQMIWMGSGANLAPDCSRTPIEVGMILFDLPPTYGYARTNTYPDTLFNVQTDMCIRTITEVCVTYQ